MAILPIGQRVRTLETTGRRRRGVIVGMDHPGISAQARADGGVRLGIVGGGSLASVPVLLDGTKTPAFYSAFELEAEL
jgi:hypothetical protein